MFVSYIDPITKENLSLENHFYKGVNSSSKWPIIRSIPRFCKSENYAENFGYQWNIFDKNQIENYLNFQKNLTLNNFEKISEYLSNNYKCRTQLINEYFGHNNTNECKICDNCLNI